MKGRRRAILLATAILAISSIEASPRAPLGQAQRTLPRQHQKWLDEDVAYVISPKEREVFLALLNDRERDIFIEAFWKHRDSIPETPENEFRTEHYKRLAYANQYFGRETTRPGWRTDRGRIHILLGPPRDISGIEGQGTVFPAQIWFYESLDQPGLPSNFTLIFYRKDGVGEHILYSPIADGPSRLLVNFQGDPLDREGAYITLRNYDSRLARAALSLIPDDSPLLGQPSLASEQILGQIASLPERLIDPKYAEAYLKYKDRIDVEYSANYVPSDAIVKVFQDDAGLFFLHYALEPKRLSILAQEGRYRIGFALNGIVTDERGRVVFQYEKTIPFDVESGRLDDIRKTSLVIQDMIPLLPGDFTFSLLMKNTFSKEFTSLESRVHIPRGEASLWMGNLLLGHQLKPVSSAPGFHKPFQVGSHQISCRPSPVFSRKDRLIVFFQVFGDAPRAGGRVRTTIIGNGREVKSADQTLAATGRRDILEVFSLEDVPAGHYALKASLLDVAGAENLAQIQEFDVSSSPEIPTPWMVSKVSSAAAAGEYEFILGSQAANAGRLEEAERDLRKAWQGDPSPRRALAYGQILNARREFGRAKSVLSPHLGEEKTDERILGALAAARQGLGEYADAAALYQEVLLRAGLDLAVLNALGECYFRLGRFDEALKSWEKSLAIDPRQEDIQKRAAEAKTKK